MRFFLIPKGLLYSTLNIKFLGRKFCSLSRGHTDRQAYRQTDTKVNTEDTLSGFHEFTPFNLSSRIGPIRRMITILQAIVKTRDVKRVNKGT